MASNLSTEVTGPKKARDLSALEAASSGLPRLPLEIIEEILARLPPEFLTQFRSVCTSWNSLISDQRFVKKHLCESIINNRVTHHKIFILPGSGVMLLRSFPVDSILREKSGQLAENLYFPMRREVRIFGLVGSCNGLVCFFVGDSSGDEIFVCNPYTRESRKFPCKFSTSLVWNKYGFGYDSSTDDYKIVRIDNLFRRGGQITVDVLPLSTCSARKIQDFPYCNRVNDDGSPYGIFLNGALHWTARRYPVKAIVALDLATETYGEIPQPEFEDGNSRPMLKLGVAGGSLLLLCHYRKGRRHDVWLMKEYGVKQSWTKLVKVSCADVPSPAVRFPKLIFISRDGAILMIHQNSLVLYSPEEDKFHTLSHGFSDYCDNGYQLRARLEFDTVGSLVSPNVIMGK